MWTAILLNGVLSIIIIFIANQLWEYCKINYTVKKTKNVVEFQACKYKQIAEDMACNVNGLLEEQNRETREVDIVRTPELRSSVGVRGLSAQAVDGLPSKDNGLIVDTQPPLIKLKNTDFLPQEEKEWMNNELASFINTL